MPPKKDAAVEGKAPEQTIKGFDAKETKLLAAAFLAINDDGKVDFAVMGELTGNTAGTLKKYWPNVRNKAALQFPGFAKLTGSSGGNAAGPAKGRKRKADAGDDADANENENDADAEPSDDKNADNKLKGKGKATKKGRPSKKAKAAEAADGETHSGGAKDEEEV